MAINCWCRVGGKTVPQDCSVSPLQQDAKPSPQVAEHLSFFLPILPRECRLELNEDRHKLTRLKFVVPLSKTMCIVSS